MLYSVITCAPLIGCDARGDHVMALSCSDFYTFFPFFLSPLTSSEELQVPQGRVACIFSELLFYDFSVSTGLLVFLWYLDVINNILDICEFLIFLVVIFSHLLSILPPSFSF